jgi:hypothetical protein
MDFGKKNNQITDLRKLNSYYFENYLNVYQDNDYYFYNLADSINIEQITNPEYFYLYRVIGTKAWTHISYDVYNTINLWWLICLINGIDNPVQLPENGKLIKVLKNDYLKTVLTELKRKKSNGK